MLREFLSTKNRPIQNGFINNQKSGVIDIYNGFYFSNLLMTRKLQIAL
ncbi:MAG: hypothetical protein BWY70_01918 [Bacteroidetes bacterium ADurb.Bin408]|nr:MAG: hypothetical protein BWY70_01918 [Bacteroidetes bacterium ADurb.Bin408]